MSLKQRSRKIAREQFWEKHDRDNYKCPDCGRTETESTYINSMESAFGFEVHHKNGKPMDNRPENQIALCRLCHNLREGKKPSRKDIKSLRQSMEYYRAGYEVKREELDHHTNTEEGSDR